MKRICGTFLTIVLMLGLCACGQNVQASWQEQYDLGIKYLSEGNYEEAVIAFTAAIEIDAKRPEAYIGRGDAYALSGDTEENLSAAQADYEAAIALDETLSEAWLGLADVYIRQGDYDKALEVLREALEKTGNDQIVADKLAEMESGIYIDSSGEERMRQYFEPDGTLRYYTVNLGDQGDGVQRQNMYGPNGALWEYYLSYWNEDRTVQYSDSYDSSGILYARSIRVENEDGIWLYSASLNENGEEITRSEAVYDENGTCLGWDNYSNGLLTSYARYEGDTIVYYDKEGNITQYSE